MDPADMTDLARAVGGEGQALGPLGSVAHGKGVPPCW
jgi:hypothetical protein